ncbi:hypothetical protein O1611_g5015 [Lasiodiplodia mahajangana]|uniref:Uncharacterized protein n=1 Tax=Lasiodiplodia mahajangana TaxID=1108764 RepID=A0ACC2JMH7_9PEZI|nr:hypothetical protein O1611_g5015 [Lasiodiplodia mahajangana]
MAQITSGGEDRIDKATEILAASFHQDPLYTYILHDLAESKRKEYLPKLFRGVVTASVLNGGSIVEVGDWSACAVFMPPGRKPDNVHTLVQAGIASMIWNLGIAPAKRLIIEYPAAVDQAIAGVLDKEEIRAGYWYGILMCTKAGNRQKGFASSLVSYVQDLARIDGRPVWIEAPSMKTAQLYLKLGLEHAGQIVVGKGIFRLLAACIIVGFLAWQYDLAPANGRGNILVRSSALLTSQSSPVLAAKFHGGTNHPYSAKLTFPPGVAERAAMDITLSHLQSALWLWLFASILYVVIKHRLEGPDHLNNLQTAFPTVGHRNEWFSDVRTKIKSLWKTADWAAEGYIKYTKLNTPYMISTLDRGQMIVLPHGQMKMLYKLPEDRLDVFGTLQQQIQAQYTVRDQRVVRDPYHRYLIPSQITRELNTLTPKMVTEIESGFESIWGTETEWKEVPLWKACFHVVARATNVALCGAPLCNNKEYLQCLDKQSTAFFAGSTLISITPEFLRSITGFLVRLWCLYYSKKFARICGPHIEERVRETRAGVSSKMNIKYKDGLQLIIDEAISRDDSTQLATSLIADRILITNNVTLQGVTFTVQHLLLCLMSSDPSLGYIETLREECRKALDHAGGTWNLEAVRSLKLVDSAIRESMRITPFASIAMSRTVVDPQGIEIQQGSSAAVVIPWGTLLGIPIESIHYDDDIYPDARRFNPFRFVTPQPLSGEKATLAYTTSKPATTADDQFFGFGTSKNPCPGRFLAVHEVKLVLAHILLNYELQYMEWNPQLPSILSLKVPKLDATIHVRRRS